MLVVARLSAAHACTALRSAKPTSANAQRSFWDRGRWPHCECDTKLTAALMACMHAAALVHGCTEACAKAGLRAPTGVM